VETAHVMCRGLRQWLFNPTTSEGRWHFPTNHLQINGYDQRKGNTLLTRGFVHCCFVAKAG
jgi:hypothetical protein